MFLHTGLSYIVLCPSRMLFIGLHDLIKTCSESSFEKWSAFVGWLIAVSIAIIATSYTFSNFIEERLRIRRTRLSLNDLSRLFYRFMLLTCYDHVNEH